jgi:hypothetical protein
MIPTVGQSQSRREEDGTMRFRVSMLLVGALTGLILSDAVSAQSRVEEKVGFAVTGEITAIDVSAKKLTVKSTNDEGVVYSVSDTASIMSGSNKLTFSDLKKGWSVVLNGQSQGDARVATYIKVVKNPSP